MSFLYFIIIGIWEGQVQIKIRVFSARGSTKVRGGNKMKMKYKRRIVSWT